MRRHDVAGFRPGRPASPTASRPAYRPERRTDFELQYPVRARQLVPLRFTFTRRTWQSPSFDSGGV